jgi:hypothetical protein
MRGASPGGFLFGLPIHFLAFAFLPPNSLKQADNGIFGVDIKLHALEVEGTQDLAAHHN